MQKYRFQAKPDLGLLPLINSIVYLKDWLRDHPTSVNNESWLFVGGSHNNYAQRLSEDGLYSRYVYYYRNSYFPKLIQDETVSPRDKSYIKTMLMKPWNLYIFRHSALTEKSQILKESTLRDHAGWTSTSKMPQVYIHYFGNESSKSLLEAYGIEDYQQKQINLLKNKNCPNCNEPNKPESKFCARCRMVLTFEAYNETLLKDREKELEFKAMQEKMTAIEESQREIQDLLKEPARFMSILTSE